MSHDDVDRTANTAKFQAFVDEDATPTSSSRRSGTPVGVLAAVIAVAIALGIVAWLLLAG